MKILRIIPSGVFGVLLCLLLAACAGPAAERGKPAGRVDPRILETRMLLEDGRVSDALRAAIDLSREVPDTPGLRELQMEITAELTRQRSARALRESQSSIDRMHTDILENRLVPDTYGVTRRIRPDGTPWPAAPTSMQAALKRPVSVHLEDVTLRDFVLAIGKSENINIIMDQMEDTPTMTLHADNTPLKEILDYVSRNIGVQFAVGENIIWVTEGTPDEVRIPMETRVFPLRKGLSMQEIEAGTANVEEALQRFVPQPQGSDLLFNPKAHLLIVKNTRDNLALTEQIVAAMDVVPPQVLIEARFISTQIADMRELGVDWVLDSAVTVSRQRVLRDGANVGAPRTVITADSRIGFTPFAGDARGLNLTYQGLLTDPMFQAVLHALDRSGKSRTLSVPKVTTVNNRAARIRVGEDFRYFEEYDTISIPSQVSDGGQTVYTSTLVPVGVPRLEELGIILTVTPSVGADMSSITLHMVPEIRDFVRYEEFNVAARGRRTGTTGTIIDDDRTIEDETSLIKVPIFRISEVETEVIVRSGETVVTGGLISSSESKSQEKVPILGSVPLLGALFRRDVTEETRQNLLIFVTATILSERGENLIPIEEVMEEAEGEGDRD